MIDLSRVPISAAARQLDADEKGSGVFFANAEAPRQSVAKKLPTPWACLSDGEDFELILAVPPDDAARMIAEQPLAGVPLSDIGEFIDDAGLWNCYPAATAALCRRGRI